MPFLYTFSWPSLVSVKLRMLGLKETVPSPSFSTDLPLSSFKYFTLGWLLRDSSGSYSPQTILSGIVNILALISVPNAQIA